MAYLECKLAALSAANAVNCDCEKQTDIDKIADEGMPASKSHTHISVDEFFSNPVNDGSNTVAFLPSKKPAVIYEEAALNGNSNTPYRPPQA